MCVDRCCLWHSCVQQLMYLHGSGRPCCRYATGCSILQHIVLGIVLSHFCSPDQCFSALQSCSLWHLGLVQASLT
jgi:hypothetical protein